MERSLVDEDFDTNMYVNTFPLCSFARTTDVTPSLFSDTRCADKPLAIIGVFGQSIPRDYTKLSLHAFESLTRANLEQ